MASEKEDTIQAEEKSKRRGKKFSEAEMEMSKTFRKQLKRLCIDRKITKDNGIIKDLGFRQSRFSEIKTGLTMPTALELKKIADYFGVTIDSLLTDAKKDGVVVDWRSLTLKQAFWILDDMIDAGLLTSYQGLPNILSDTIKKWRCTAIQIKQSSIQEQEHVLEILKLGFCEGLPNKQLEYYCGWETDDVCVRGE